MGGQTAQALLKQPLDHVVFTGGTTIGREVMKAAAEQLRPVTLSWEAKAPASFWTMLIFRWCPADCLGPLPQCRPKLRGPGLCAGDPSDAAAVGNSPQASHCWFYGPDHDA